MNPPLFYLSFKKMAISPLTHEVFFFFFLNISLAINYNYVKKRDILRIPHLLNTLIDMDFLPCDPQTERTHNH